MSSPVQRKLTTILAADADGYSRVMEADELRRSADHRLPEPQHVAIRVRNLDAISALIDATVADGANELQGIQFTFQDEEASLDAARAQAVQTARTRAERYAEAAGMRVARVVSIAEPGANLPPPDYRRDGGYMLEQAAAQNVASSPINPGALDNRTNVTVVFELR